MTDRPTPIACAFEAGVRAWNETWKDPKPGNSIATSLRIALTAAVQHAEDAAAALEKNSSSQIFLIHAEDEVGENFDLMVEADSLETAHRLYDEYVGEMFYIQSGELTFITTHTIPRITGVSKVHPWEESLTDDIRTETDE